MTSTIDRYTKFITEQAKSEKTNGFRHHSLEEESSNESLKDIMSFKDRQSYTFHHNKMKSHTAAASRIRRDDLKREHHRKMARFHLDHVNALVSKYYHG